MSISKCLLLISELMVGKWVRNSLERPICGPRLPSPWASQPQSSSRSASPSLVLGTLGCSWDFTKLLVSLMKKLTLQKVIYCVQSQRSYQRQSQDRTSSPSYKLRSGEVSWWVHQRVPWGVLFFTVALTCLWKERWGLLRTWQGMIILLSAKACGLEPITIIYYLPDNVILTRNSCLAMRAGSIWIDPTSGHIFLACVEYSPDFSQQVAAEDTQDWPFENGCPTV